MPAHLIDTPPVFSETRSSLAVPVLEPIAEPAADPRSLIGLTELLLKNPAHVDVLNRDAERQRELIPRFLAISLIGFSIFSLALVLVLQSAPAAALPAFLQPERWGAQPTGSALCLWLAYTVGLVAATGVCLPSFYFYGLLAGVKITWLQVTAQIMKGKASTSVLLMGVLPIYVAVVLGLTVFHADPDRVRAALLLGLVLPFLAGTWGVQSIYRGFIALADTLPAKRRTQRTFFLGRLTLMCAACYTAVTPLMIYRLWDYFAQQTAGLGF
jgi:hypothetical protein